MNQVIEIPEHLSHLKVSDKGYPIPFFVGYKDGIADFRLLDIEKQNRCLQRDLCSVCGKSLIKKNYFFITGPMGLANKVATDPPMHRECAEYSLAICPHLHLQQAKRRIVGLQAILANRTNLDPGKPDLIYLVKSEGFHMVPHPDQKQTGAVLIRYSIKSKEEYHYQGGILVKK
jgi:hypothetical protein